MSKKGMTYANAGVDYKQGVDNFKVLAQKAAGATDEYLDKTLGVVPVPESRGESAFLLEFEDHYVAHVEEGLGTKSLVADQVAEGIKGFHTYIHDNIAKDAVAMMINDLATLGARPLSTAMHLAVHSSDWFSNRERFKDLIEGWQRSCQLAHCVWAGGETPVLQDILQPGASLLSGSAVGIIKPKSRRIDSKNIRAGDIILMVESSGIHANGLTLARRIAEHLKKGYKTRMPTGEEYGISLLRPTIIYSPLVSACIDAGVEIHYAVHITGHGWRKFMRAREPFRYVVEVLPRSLPIFEFIQSRGKVEVSEMFSVFNMNAGFALIVPPHAVSEVIKVAGKLAGEMQAFNNVFHVFRAGHVEESERKEVYIKPLDLLFEEKDMKIR